MKPLSTLMVRIMLCYLLFEFDSDTCSQSCVVSYTHYCAQRFTACNITGPTWPMFMSLTAHNMNYISQYKFNHYTPGTRKLLGGILVSLRPSVRPSVRPACIPWPLCSPYSFGWIHFISIHLIKQLKKVCHEYSFLQNCKISIFGNFF